MKKRIRLLSAVLAVSLLSGCASSVGKQSPTDPPTPDASSGDGIPVADSGRAVDPRLPGVCETETLYDDGAVSFRLLYGTDDQTGSKKILLRSENKGEDRVIAALDSFLLNEAVATDAWNGDLEPGGVAYTEMLQWEKSLFLAGEETLRTTTGKVKLFRGYSEDPYAEEEVLAAFRNGGSGLFCDRLRNANIPPQVLLDNDACRLTLLCFGQDPLSGAGQYRGILFAENKTDEDLPLQFNGCIVNRRTLVSVGGSLQTVPSGGAISYPFTCCDDDFALQRIEKVRSVKLLILKDREENTGTRFINDGGRWYPLTIENPDNSPEAPVEEGMVLLEKSGVRVRLLEAVPQKQETFGGECRYIWELFVENGKDENIEIQLEDCTVDGDSDVDLWDAPYLTCEVGAGSACFCRLTSGSVPAESPCPVISGTLRGYVLGGTRVLFDSDPVTFPR